MKPKRIEDIPEVKSLLEKKRQATLLKPQESEGPLPFSASKMGGIPNMNLFEEWPKCDVCNTPLNFVLQLYKNEYPEFYFPENVNVFLLFRCPNFFCKEAFSKHCDLKLFWFYGEVNTETNKEIEKPPLLSEDFEGQMQECIFRPTKKVDYQHYLELGEKWEKFEEKYGDNLDVIDEFINAYYPHMGTKINGFPTWVEHVDYPVCACGETKDFFFQLSSEEDEGDEESLVEWPPYAAVIGESCNIYFFVCRKCGSDSIETRCETFL